MSIDIKNIAKIDRDDKNVTRIGRTAYIVRKVDVAEFHVEDTRLWDPVVARVTSYDFAIQYVEELLTSAPR